MTLFPYSAHQARIRSSTSRCFLRTVWSEVLLSPARRSTAPFVGHNAAQSRCGFEDDVAGRLVEVPRNSIAGFHREYVNLHCGRDWVAVTEVIYSATQGQRNVGQRQGRGAEYGHKADGCNR